MAYHGNLKGFLEERGDFFRIQTQTGWGNTLVQFANWCNPLPGWRVLDAGCGPGLLPAIFKQLGCQAYGVDLDPNALSAGMLHPELAIADAARLPFEDSSFQIVTASNLLFFLEEPLPVLKEMARVTVQDGQICILNPSEYLSVSAAAEFADQRGLVGLARSSFIGWADRAEKNQRWTESQSRTLFKAAGLHVSQTALKIGPGFVRYISGKR